MGVFKAYDVRGIYGQGIDLKLSYNIGRVFAQFSDAPALMVGYDARVHSGEMCQSLIKGLLDEGRHVYAIGMASTPQLHYLQLKGHIPAAVMVTASHNPPEYHGFKFFGPVGESISRENGLQKIERMVAKMDAPRTTQVGRLSEVDQIADYIEFLKSAANGEKLEPKVVIDTSNGSSGRVFEHLAKELGLNAFVINVEPDGKFPNHEPNPLSAGSGLQLAQKVRETGADLGALIDGDGDRVIFFDETGNAVPGYFSGALLAEELLRLNPGSAIVYDLIASRALPEWISEHGGVPIESRVGYTYIYDAMVSHGAIFGCETSGHVYFRVTDSFYTESAAYATVVLLKLLQSKALKLSDLVLPLKVRYFQAPETNLAVKDREAALARLEQKFSGQSISKLDGLSIALEDCWFNLRASNTEPLLRLRLEATSGTAAQNRLEEVIKLVEMGESNEN